MPDDSRARLHAPYNFVPLSKHVRTEWGPDPSQDIPYRDGLSGTLAITVTADTPLLVSGSDEVAPTDDRNVTDGDATAARPKRFFRSPDGTPAIPGSSLRGMVRNVVEIIGYGKFQLVDDRRYGLRDLTAAARLDYGAQFTEKTGDRRYRARSLAGWLSRGRDGGWLITPCAFARIDHGQLAYLSPQFATRLADIKKRREQDERTAEKLVEAWESLHGSIDPIEPMPFSVEPEATAHRHSPGGLMYREAFVPGRVTTGTQTEERRGTLVFTGQPGQKKHLEFVFLDGEAGPPIEISPKVWNGFIAVHEGQEKPSPTWEFWRERLATGAVSRIPVFYLLDQRNRLRALGLALMFKLAQDDSTHDLIRSAGGDHLPGAKQDDAGLDLAERMFGLIDEAGAGSFKGRIDIGLARLIDPERFEAPTYKTILGAPKPSFFPAYVRQVDFTDGEGAALASRERPGRDDREVAQYRTYMPWRNATAELRGWKRYPARGPGSHPPKQLNASQEKSAGSHVRLQPLQRDGGLAFEGLVHFHNLLPVELGALVWALEWGGDPALRHGLGMGKPFGWGQVSVRIEREHRRLRVRPNRPEALAPSLEICRDEFVAAMEAWALRRGIAGGWAAGPQLRRLRAMADPSNVGLNGPLGYPVLDPERRINGFQEAKRNGLVLREYWDRSDEQAFQEWRQGKRKQPPVAIPALSQVKGFAPEGTPAPQAAGPGRAQTPGPQLFRRGERVRNIAESEELAAAMVVEEQASPGALVLIRYDDGSEEKVGPRMLQRVTGWKP